MSKWFFFVLFYVCINLYAGPLLVYNQYPRVWGMDFKAMTAYVTKIRELGFNVVWVNPFFQSSDTVVKRFNKFTGEELDVKGSLYAMKLDGSCKPEMQDTQENIIGYTSTVSSRDMIPIFDLVLNHIAKDSLAIKEHPSWFKEQDSHWDDICPFNYTDENRSEIFETIWRPLLDQMVELGFQGMRVDYGTDVDQATLRMCVVHLRTKIKDPLIVFGEALIPVGKDVRGVLASCRNSGFTHLTNLSVFLSKGQILQGKRPDNPLGYQWFLHDLGLKKSTCSGKCGDFWTGTVGFSGSHDHGTTLLGGILNSIPEKEILRYYKAHSKEFTERGLKLIKKKIAGILAVEKLSSATPKQKLEIVKERMAIAAFSSDAGWYCFSSDEWLSEVAKSPFVCSDGAPFHREESIPSEGNAKIVEFIKNINSTFLRLREAPKVFWVEVFYTDDSSHLIFVRHISGKQLPADVVCVKIKEDTKDYNDEDVKRVLTDKHAELGSFENVNFHCLR